MEKVLKYCNYFDIILLVHGAIGEVVNTADCGPVMHEFDSHIAPHDLK